jgi:hypothetical protein
LTSDPTEPNGIAGAPGPPLRGGLGAAGHVHADHEPLILHDFGVAAGDLELPSPGVTIVAFHEPGCEDSRAAASRRGALTLVESLTRYIRPG